MSLPSPFPGQQPQHPSLHNPGWAGQRDREREHMHCTGLASPKKHLGAASWVCMGSVICLSSLRVSPLGDCLDIKLGRSLLRTMGGTFSYPISTSSCWISFGAAESSAPKQMPNTLCGCTSRAFFSPSICNSCRTLQHQCLSQSVARLFPPSPPALRRASIIAHFNVIFKQIKC